jgi:hypothetical protein
MWGLIALLACLAGLAGLISIIVPLRFLRITSRLKGLAIVGASFIVLVIVGSQIPSPHDTTTSTAASSPQATLPDPNLRQVAVAAVADPKPQDQHTFIQIVEGARDNYLAADTDFKKGATRPARSTLLCRSRQNYTVSNWVGEVVGLTTNGDGKGVIGVRISDHITLKTWNNSLSDVADETLIEPNSSLFTQLGDLKNGDQVRFTGRLFLSNVDCFKESSMTLSGSMRDPDFIIRFTDIEKL